MQNTISIKLLPKSNVRSTAEHIADALENSDEQLITPHIVAQQLDIAVHMHDAMKETEGDVGAMDLIQDLVALQLYLFEADAVIVIK